jgi:hypothetical protein
MAPSTRVNCGYACAFGGSTQVNRCADTDAAGKWKDSSEDAAPLPCTGLAPIVTLPDVFHNRYLRIE